MIPRHRPPFGFSSLAAAVFSGSGLNNVEQLEQAYAAALNAPHAVWLPSARYGIFQAIRIALGVTDTVCCPAFTCHVVHQAVRQTARPVRLIDCCENSPLMETSGLRDRQNFGVVLSEIFGIRYQSCQTAPLLSRARLRIFDMAMCIPGPADIQRLVDSDVALISFGLGKSLFAGWGGMAFTKDRWMADALRSARDNDIRKDSGPAAVRRIASVWLRTAAHSRLCYRLSRLAASSRRTVRSESDSSPSSSVVSEQLRTSEWRQAPSPFHLKLATANLKRSESFERDRILYSSIYRGELSQHMSRSSGESSGLLRFLPTCDDAMSHFSVRVQSDLRDDLRAFLWQRGVDTATFFPFPAGADAAALPNAFRLAQEILCLPLSNGLGERNIRHICSLIRRFSDRYAASTTEVRRAGRISDAA